MDNGFPFFDIILFAMVAGFLILRLRNVLGRRDGHEGGHHDLFRAERRADETPDNVIHIPGRDDPDATSADDESPQTPLAAGLIQIKDADPGFDGEGLLSGAQIAFEMILGAYASGDRKALKPLLNAEVFDNFSHSIQDREDQGHTLDETLVGIRSVEIVEAYMEGGEAYVTVKFISEQVTVTRDAEGNVVEGDPNVVSEVTDFWTFARDMRSRDPNWTLVATRSLD